jgi:hypothetical protein
MSNWSLRGGSSDDEDRILIMTVTETEKFAVALRPRTLDNILRWDGDTIYRNQLNGDRGYFTPITNLRIEATIGNEDNSFTI